MRRIINKIIYYFKILGALFYLLFSRIKNRNNTRGVAEVVESFNSGGLEQVAANIYKGFKKSDRPSVVICLSNNVGPMCQQLETPMDLRIVYYNLYEFIMYCAKKNIGSLIFHFTTYHFIFLKLIGFKTYYIVHNTYIWYTDSEWQKLKFKLKFATGIIAVSKWCQSYFEKKTGIKNTKLILNGIDFANLKKGEKSSTTRETLKISNNTIACLMVGSYTEGKHQMALIGIMKEILKTRKDIKIVCAGPVLNKKYYEQFIKSIKKENLEKYIIPLKYIPQEQVGDFVNQCADIYLQPSVHEAGVPLTVMEALAMGKPVIMTDFMIKETFPNCERIEGIKAPYDNILDVTPNIASKMGYKETDDSTKSFAERICNLSDKIDYYKKSDNFKIEDYNFLKVERMQKEYLEFIK
jgi:glycosyltransferase involved in cell wall biosynthesis